MIRSEIVRSESVSPRLQIHGPFAQRQRSFCLRLFHLCSSWAKNSGPKRHFCFSAISRKAWLMRLRRAGAINSLVFHGFTSPPPTRGGPNPTLPSELTDSLLGVD